MAQRIQRSAVSLRFKLIKRSVYQRTQKCITTLRFKAGPCQGDFLPHVFFSVASLVGGQRDPQSWAPLSRSGTGKSRNHRGHSGSGRKRVVVQFEKAGGGSF